MLIVVSAIVTLLTRLARPVQHVCMRMYVGAALPPLTRVTGVANIA